MKIIKGPKKEQDYSLFSAAADAGITMDQMNDEVHHGDAVLGLL